MQVKEAERNKRLEQLVDEACSAEALEDISSHGRQLRPLHQLDFKHRNIKRVRHQLSWLSKYCRKQMQEHNRKKK